MSTLNPFSGTAPNRHHAHSVFECIDLQLANSVFVGSDLALSLPRFLA